MYTLPMMKTNTANKTDAQLEYIATDCEAAVSAMPTNPKTRTYLDTMDACRAELALRDRKRIFRKQVKNSGFDKLTVRKIDGYHNAKIRRNVWNTSFNRSAAFMLASIS